MRGLSRPNIAFPRGLEVVERSHWIPKRMLPPSLQWANWNIKLMWGSQHALVDPGRYRFLPKWWKTANPMLPRVTGMWIRMPNWVQGSLLGSAYGASSMTVQKMVALVRNPSP